MTAQFSDRFIYQGKTYDLVAFSAGEPFHPAELGFRPVGGCSACWRGYISEYAIDPQAHLVLRNLYLSLYDVDGDNWKGLHGEPLNGVEPVTPDEGDHDFLNNHYLGVDVQVAYDGGLLIGDGFVRELYVHMGFHPAWKYREVHELEFEKGKLLVATDRSGEMAEFRRGMEEREVGPDPEPDQVQQWIERCFSRKYR